MPITGQVLGTPARVFDTADIARTVSGYSAGPFEQGQESTMYEFQIPNMTCGHCVKTVTEAVKTADPAAEIKIDLPRHQVQVQSTAPRERLVAQLKEAGYSPA
jgi:copper chaperone